MVIQLQLLSLCACEAAIFFLLSIVMDLQGKITKFNVPDIFQLISTGRRTGTLGVNRQKQAVLFYFNDGQITYAYRPNQYNRLGDRLLAKEIINDAALEKSLHSQKQLLGKKRLGKILLDSKLINEQQLRSVLTEQITDIVSRVMAWDTGTFKFYDGKFPTKEELDLSLSTENLILEGARRVDELHRFQEQLPEITARLKIKPLTNKSEIELKLTAMEWNILTCCSSHRSLDNIVHESQYDPVDTLKTIIKLMNDDLIEISHEPSDELSNESSSQLELQIKNLSDLMTGFLSKG